MSRTIAGHADGAAKKNDAGRGRVARSRHSLYGARRSHAARPSKPDPALLERLHAAAGNRAVDQLVRSSIDAGGAPLPDAVRTDMEDRFDHDFTGVRVHADRTAAHSAHALGARAYTVGEDVVFSPRRFAPDTPAGKQLLAHELAHVVQQSRGGARPRTASPDAQLESDASRAASSAIATGPIAVSGSSGVGVAMQEEEEEKSWFDVATGVLTDVAISTVAGPVLGPLASPDLVKAAVNDAVEVVTGEDNPDTPGLREVASDKALETIGFAKGAALQGAEIIDTGLWFGDRYQQIKEEAVDTGLEWAKEHDIPAPDRDTALQIVGTVASVLPGTSGLEGLADANDALESVGLVDPDTGKASLAKPVQIGYDALGDWTEEKIGAKKRDDDSFFTPMEKGELEGAITTQVLLALTGVEEVKVVLAVAGAAGGFKGVVESVEQDPEGWYENPAFWSSAIMMVLSIAGLKSTRAASKITNILIKSGALLAAVPAVWQLVKDYRDPELAKDPERQHKVLVADWGQVISIVKDAALQVIHSASSKGRKSGADKSSNRKKSPKTSTPPSEVDEGASKSATKTTATTEPSTKTTGTDVSPSEKTTTPIEEPAAGKKTAKTKAKKVAPKKSAPKKTKPKQAAGTAVKEPANKKAPKTAAKKAAPKKAAAKKGESKKAASKKAAPKKAAPKKAAPKKAAPKKAAPKKAAPKKPEPKKPGSKKADSKTAAAPPIEEPVAGKKTPKAAAKPKPKTDAKRKGAGRKTVKPLVAPDKESAFDQKDIEFSPDEAARLGKNKEPVVWVNTGKGKARGTFYPEGSRYFGKTKSGVAMPQSQAEANGFRPAGSAPVETPIEPRVVRGRQAESRGAASGKGARFVGATTETKEGITTAIRPDLAESHAYNHLLERGEVGLQRPLGSNVSGVDAITAQIEYDSSGRPVRAKIFLNDVTAPDVQKGSKASHAAWQREMIDAIDPKRLDLGDPAAEAAVRKAAADGDIFVRIVRVDYSGKGQGAVRINPSETRRFGALDSPPPIFPLRGRDPKDRDKNTDDEELDTP